MFARVTLFEIDTLRISIEAALKRFKESVMPEAQKREGYQGLYVLGTPEGRGVIVSLWATEEAARAGVESGYYDEQLAKFVAVYRAPPGREHYEVFLADVPSMTQK